MKIKTEEQLRELYGFPSGRAKDKVFETLDKHAVNFIEKSPFLVLSTSDDSGKMDASPRGGEMGFVKVIDNSTLIIPDSKGNNIMDSIGNIIDSGRVGLLFLIPGIGETLRINGRAYISTNKDYMDLFLTEKNPPKSCIVVTVEESFLHCAKALMRSKLWDESSKMDKKEFPSMGQMLKDQLGSKEDPESREDMVKRYTPDL
ncbi:MAG: pyridoxamine 5'-phosphate oxidase family protein [Algibacter sp.]